MRCQARARRRPSAAPATRASNRTWTALAVLVALAQHETNHEDRAALLVGVRALRDRLTASPILEPPY